MFCFVSDLFILSYWMVIFQFYRLSPMILKTQQAFKNTKSTEMLSTFILNTWVIFILLNASIIAFTYLLTLYLFKFCNKYSIRWSFTIKYKDFVVLSNKVSILELCFNFITQNWIFKTCRCVVAYFLFLGRVVVVFLYLETYIYAKCCRWQIRRINFYKHNLFQILIFIFT